eukprot:gene7681-8517_t
MANNNSNDVLGQQNNTRLDVVEDSIAEIWDTLLQASIPSNSQAQPMPAPGMSPTVEQGGQASFPSVPSFLRAAPSMLPSSSADSVGDNSTPGPSYNQASSLSLTLGNMANLSQDVNEFKRLQVEQYLQSCLRKSLLGRNEERG